jgi:predicted CxxxxCH...CXXCH cytochrome family protein
MPTSYKTVGAHQKHLLGSSLANAILCSECHQVPGSVASTGHLDLTPGAEVIFGTAATDTTQGVYPNPTYDRSTASCSGTYCHGNFKNGNTANAPVWTGGTVQAACGSCHGLPPKTVAQGGTHPASSGLLNCYTCHGTVISNSGAIINKSLHMNGVINF